MEPVSEYQTQVQARYPDAQCRYSLTAGWVVDSHGQRLGCSVSSLGAWGDAYRRLLEKEAMADTHPVIIVGERLEEGRWYWVSDVTRPGTEPVIGFVNKGTLFLPPDTHVPLAEFTGRYRAEPVSSPKVLKNAGDEPIDYRYTLRK